MKKIVILEAVPGSAQGYRYVLWAAVTEVSRRPFYAKPSTWLSAWTGASGIELAALRAGEFVEDARTFNNETPLTLAQVKAQLETVWTEYQAFIDAYNPWDRYGSFFEGSSWTNAGAI